MPDTMTVEELENDYDWNEVFAFVLRPGPVQGYDVPSRQINSVSIQDVKKIIAISNGERDESDWVGLFKLENGLYLGYQGWL